MSLGKRKRDGTLVLRVKKESPDAIIPYKATEGSAGYDLTRYLSIRDSCFTYQFQILYNPNIHCLFIYCDIL